MSEDDASASAQDAWRKDGRCSACRFFVSDFGEPPELYGHCKMYPRPGARESTDYACGEYVALPGFAALTESTSPDRVIAERASERASRRSVVPSGSARRSRRRAAAGPKIVLRRRDEDGTMLEAASRGATPIDADVVAALTGQGGEDMDPQSLRDVLIDVVENFLAIEDVELGGKWEGGNVVIHPGDPELKPHEIPIDAFFHKVVMIRDRLRVLEQKINANDSLSDADKVDLQQYISRCYGSLTSFNVLFKNREDRFSSK